MKVLLLKDVYKLGRAGEVKRVADGYGRNYLLPQGLAVLATQGAMKQAERIRKTGELERARLNEELSSVAEVLKDLTLSFPMKAGETGKLYGSVTTTMVAEEIMAESGIEVDKRDIDAEPIKTLGVHQVAIRLTIDLVPEFTVLVHREGEPPESAYELEEEELAEEEIESFAELKEELDAEAEAEEQLEAEAVTLVEEIEEMAEESDGDAEAEGE
ncbi:MAG: 50S ribosomal protein L9 [Anaerolineales bacterium]